MTLTLFETRMKQQQGKADKMRVPRCPRQEPVELTALLVEPASAIPEQLSFTWQVASATCPAELPVEVKSAKKIKRKKNA